MARKTRDDAGNEGTVRDGGLIIDESITRREGLVEYEGTVDDRGETVRSRDVSTSREIPETPVTGVDAGSPGAMQAGATVLGGLSSEPEVTTRPAPVDDTIGGINMDTEETRVLASVHEGMTVVDANGDEVGTVEYIKMGDPQAVTTMGEEINPGDGGLVGDLAGAFTGGGGEPDVPEPFRSELLRMGFVKVDGPGWFGKDRYFMPNRIARVSGDTVALNVTKDAIPNDQM
jgi:hypothetical protein